MVARFLNKIIRKQYKINPTEKMTLIIIAESVGVNHQTDLSAYDIAERLCVGIRTAFRSIKTLEQLGYISIIRTAGKSNTYIFTDANIKNVMGV